MDLKRTDIGREGTVFCGLRGGEIGIFLPDDEVTEEYAERCVEAMNHMSDEMIDVICRAAKAYCLYFMEETGDCEDDMTIPVTPETPPREILKCFTPTMLTIDAPMDETKIGYQLECDCDWEPEHGMEIDILDGKVVYLSSFDGCSPWEYQDGDWNFVNRI